MEKSLSETSLNYLEILILPITETLTQSQTPVDPITNATIHPRVESPIPPAAITYLRLLTPGHLSLGSTPIN